MSEIWYDFFYIYLSITRLLEKVEICLRLSLSVFLILTLERKYLGFIATYLVFTVPLSVNSKKVVFSAIRFVGLILTICRHNCFGFRIRIYIYLFLTETGFDFFFAGQVKTRDGSCYSFPSQFVNIPRSGFYNFI